MHFIKYILIIIISFAQYSCTFNKINNIHGVNNLIEKSKLIKIDSSNRNDVTKILGPSIIKDENENKMSYFEVRETKNKLGKKIIEINSYIEISFDKYNIVKKIEIFDTKKNQDLKFTEKVTNTSGVKDTFISNLLSSTRKRMKKAKEKFK